MSALKYHKADRTGRLEKQYDNSGKTEKVKK